MSPTANSPPGWRTGKKMRAPLPWKWSSRLPPCWPARPFDSSSPLVRALFAIRWTVGRLLRLDRDEAGLGARVPTLRDRLPADLRDTADRADTAPFVPLYRTDDEWALEIANQTVHGILHLAWVPDSAGGYRGQMAVLVKPNGLLGRGYMAAITPFRHLVVYPSMLRDIERSWHHSSH